MSRLLQLIRVAEHITTLWVFLAGWAVAFSDDGLCSSD